MVTVWGHIQEGMIGYSPLNLIPKTTKTPRSLRRWNKGTKEKYYNEHVVNQADPPCVSYI